MQLQIMHDDREKKQTNEKVNVLPIERWKGMKTRPILSFYMER